MLLFPYILPSPPLSPCYYQSFLLFTYLAIWLCQELAVARRIFAAAFGLSSFGLQVQ